MNRILAALFIGLLAGIVLKIMHGYKDLPEARRSIESYPALGAPITYPWRIGAMPEEAPEVERVYNDGVLDIPPTPRQIVDPGKGV